MANKILLLAIVLFVGFGCGLADRVRQAAEGESNTTTANINANKTLTDRAVDTAVGEKKIGIPECDEAVIFLRYRRRIRTTISSRRRSRRRP
jgi:hypothetical protein